MDFNTPQADVKNNVVQFLSETALYDNLFVCRNNGGQITFQPGGGQSDPGFFTIPRSILSDAVAPDDCHHTGSVNDCQQTVTYVSKLEDVPPPPNLPTTCTNAGFTTQYGCFLFLLGLIQTPAQTLTCQNDNGIIIQLITKGVCARQTALKDNTAQANGLFRYTFPSFTQPPLAVFSSTPSTEATCGACLQGTLAGCLSPNP
jgi:hypothetical protein